MSNEVKTTNGIGFCGLLTIALIVLKLCGQIDWSWWWVTSPLWIPVLFVLGVAIVCLLIVGIQSKV